jgi:ABC-type Fe3+/spermidine/putrescine transport system ATPase subunit
MIELNALSKSFGETVALRDISLTIEDDEYLTLLGPSGSGKSTLLRVIAGLDRPDSGTITMNGRDIVALPPHRRGLGIVQQNYALFPHMTVRQNIEFGLQWRDENPVTDAGELKRRVDTMLELVGLADLDNRGVGQISGGQKQRVSLARTLVTEPKICLLDEPLGALDANLRERMTIELRRIRDTLGVTFMHVTGNESEALAMGDRMIVLDHGHAVMIAPPDRVYNFPKSVRVAQVLNAYNILSGQTRDGGFEHAGTLLPMLPGSSEAMHYAIRYDAARIVDKDDPAALLQVTFLASEFTGGGVNYFLRGPMGVFEVERHLSRADPEVYSTGQSLGVTWNAEDALAFDSTDALITPPQIRGAA